MSLISKAAVSATVLVLICIGSIFAQPGGGGPPGGGGTPVPISGIEILLAVGGWFGIKKILSGKSRK
jgi:hypothetical protein